MHRNDVPERCIHRIKLGLFAVVGETVGQHAFRHGTGPFCQDVARRAELSRSQA